MTQTLPPPPQLEPEQDVEQMCALFGITHEDLIAEINYRLRAKFERAMRIQRHAAKVQGERRIIRVGDTGGEVTQQLHPVVYQALRARFGNEAMNDKGFLRDLHKNHPETKVTSRSDRLMIIKPEIGTNLAPNKRVGVHGKRGRWALSTSSGRAA